MPVTSAVETLKFQERSGYSSYTMTRVTEYGGTPAMGQT